MDGGADRYPAGSGNQDHGVVAEVFPVIGRTPPIRQPPPIRRLSWRVVASLQLPSVEDHLDARVLQELTANPREELRVIPSHDHEEPRSHTKNGTSGRNFVPCACRHAQIT